MQSATPQRWAINAYFVFTGLATFLFGLLILRIDKSWTVSDWLTNYQGGFVRRGLPGEIIYFLSHLTHLTPFFYVALLFLSGYAVLLFSFRRLALRSTYSIWALALYFSPATLAFPILDLGAGYRKEVLYLAALSYFLVLLARDRLSSRGATLYIALSLLLGTLAHESLICYAPYFFAALVLGGRTVAQAARQWAPGFALGLLSAAACAHWKGDLGTAFRICSSLGYPLLGQSTNQVCAGGALGFFGMTPFLAHWLTKVVVARYHYIPIYAALGLFALAPALAGSIALARGGWRRETLTLWVSTLAAFAASSILFYYAIDWGRWVDLHVFSIAALFLLLDGRARAAGVPIQRLRPLAFACLLAYCTLWTLPHAFAESYPRFGYASLAATVLAHLHRHIQP